MGDADGMSTITAILEPAADGSLHLPVPEELRHRRIRVVALLTAADNAAEGDSGVKGKAREWVGQARGAVQLLPGESADDLRREYYRGKYGTGS
jgi:hypothetical protein